MPSRRERAGVPVGVGADAAAAAGHRLERREVEAGAERLALARQHDHPHRPARPSAARRRRAAPANIAPSRALRFSGRFSRTSATPRSSMEMVTRSLMGPSVAWHARRHEVEPDRRRGADDDPLGAQAPRLRPSRRPGDRRGVPRDRPAGADRLEPPGLALGRRRGRRQEAGDRRRLPRATSTSTAASPAPSTSRATPGASAWTRSATRPTYLSDNFHRVPLMLIPCLWGRLDNASVVAGRRRVGLAAAGGVELHARPARARAGLGVDHHPPDERRRAAGRRASSASRSTR